MDSSSSQTLMAGGGSMMIARPTHDETSTDDPKQNLNQVITSIQETLGLVHQLYLTVSSFNVSAQLPLLQRLNSPVSELDNLIALSDKCDIQAHMEVLNLIDDGKNPDVYAKEVLNACIAKNQITRGKPEAFKGLRMHLLEELEQAFPNESESLQPNQNGWHNHKAYYRMQM